MRILNINRLQEIKKIMQDIRVYKQGIQIMAPKGLFYLIKINNLTHPVANILKQEMLSLGADVAISKDALTGKPEKTDCLLMGSLSQINRLNQKLKNQPFGLSRLSNEFFLSIKNYTRQSFLLDLGKYKLNLGQKKHIMGIVNLTPDSFSGDGFYSKIQNPCLSGRQAKSKIQIDSIVKHTEKMVRDGADIIDVGGESTHPGAKPVSLKEELKRTIPVIKLLAKKIRVPISIDTYKPQVAKAALDNGAVIVNDITALRNPEMAKVVAKYKAGVVLMHMKGKPRTMQDTPQYKSLIDDIIEYLNKAITRAVESGIDKEKIIVDPGIGFGKTLGHNLMILKGLKEFKVLGRPILVGPSRKSFIGRLLDLPPEERLFGTLASVALAAVNGADLIRVHDVREAKQALKIIDAILGCRGT